MRTRDIAAIVLAAALLLLPAAAAIDLFNPDEPREAEIAREMQASGDLVVPRFNGCAFLEKPPLVYWAVLATSRVPGLSSEMAARLPSVLSAIGLLLVVYGIGAELFDRRTGRAAAFVLLTTFQFWWLGKRAMLDMPLAFFVGATMLCFLLAHRRAGERARWLLLAGAAGAGAALTKGLIGLLIPGLAIVCYLVWRREMKMLLSPAALAAAAIPIAAIGIWTALLAARPEGACYVREFLVENHVKRFLGGGYGGHRAPLWYYLESFATDLQPWVLFYPAALIALWPGWRRSRSAVGAKDRRFAIAPPSAASQGGAFLYAWFLPSLLVLSLSSTKRSLYLLPITPALALLVAAWWRTRDRVRGNATRGSEKPDARRAGVVKSVESGRDREKVPGEVLHRHAPVTPSGQDPRRPSPLTTSRGERGRGDAGNNVSLGGGAGDKPASRRRRDWSVLVPGAILFALGTLLALAVPAAVAALLSGRTPRGAAGLLAAIVEEPSGVPAGAAMLAAVVAVALVARANRRRGAAAALLLLWTFLLVAGIALLPLAEPRLSARSLGETIRAQRDRGVKVGAWRVTEGSLGQFLFYSEGTLDWIGKKDVEPVSPCVECRQDISPEEYLAGPGPRACLMSEESYARLPEGLRRGRILARGRVGGSTYILLAGRAYNQPQG